MKASVLSRSSACEHDDPSSAARVTPISTRPVLRKTASKPASTSNMPDGADPTTSFEEALNTGIEPSIQRNGAGSIAPAAEQLVARATQGGGHTIPDGLRSRFETSLGADLSGVRVHDTSAAAEAAAAVGARAYAVGQDVFMGAGEYQPDTTGGELLLAHEVAHTVQQSGGVAAPQYKLEVSSPGDAAEVEADRAASAMVAGQRFALGSSSSGAAQSIQRWANEQGAQIVLTAIARADLATIRQIIFEIETSRANSTPGVQLPERSVTVAIADLHALDARARARFHELERQGGPAGGHPSGAAGGHPATAGHGAPAEAHGPAADGQGVAAEAHGPAADGQSTSDHGAQGVRAQTRERFRQEFNLIPETGFVIAGGWLKVRSVRVRIEAVEEQDPVPTPHGGEPFQIVAATATRRPGAPTSFGMQVETPRFREDEWAPIVAGTDWRTNFAMTTAIAREGGVITGHVGMGTVQLRGQNIPWIGEMGFECPIRVFEVARNSRGQSEIRVMEARPTFHSSPFQFGGHGPFFRVSLEFAIGPNRDKFLQELGRLGILNRRVVSEVASAAARSGGRAAAALPPSPATAPPPSAAAAPAEGAATAAAPAEGASAAAVPAEGASAAAAPAEGAAVAGEGGAVVAGESGAAAGGTTLGGVMIAGGFIIAGAATIAAALVSLAEGDAYFRQAEESQHHFYAMCASYSRVMRGLEPVGGTGSEHGERAARATLERIAQQHHVTVEHVQSLAQQLGGRHFYNQAYDQGQARVRASMRAAAQRISGVPDVDADNRVDALRAGEDIFNRYVTRWPL